MTKIKILGPPLLAKLAAGVALLIIARSLIAWDTATSLSALAVAVPAVWRILRLGVFMDENEVEVRNLITTHTGSIVRTPASLDASPISAPGPSGAVT